MEPLPYDRVRFRERKTDRQDTQNLNPLTPGAGDSCSSLPRWLGEAGGCRPGLSW